LLGLSPLSPGRPLRFQPKWVRASTGSYPRLTLPRDSSPGFASAAGDWIALLRLALAAARRWLGLAARRDSQAHSTKGTPSRGVCPLRLLVGARFQALFHSPLGVLFTFPSRYSCTIGHRGMLSLGGRSPQLRAGFHVPGPTREARRAGGAASRTGLSPCLAGLPRPFRCRAALSLRRRAQSPPMRAPATPERQRLWGFDARSGLGMLALSLAATRAVSVDFLSSGYLDVSVPRVAPAGPMDSGRGARAWPRAGSPIRASAGGSGRLRLPAAYRSLPRPSSAPVPRHPPCALDVFAQAP
jgi:hypothetical protein